MINMPTINFDIDRASMDAFSKAFKEMPGNVEVSMGESIKKTQRYLRREVVKELKSHTTLMPKYISKGVKSERIRKDGMSITGVLRIASKGIPLIRYEVNPQNPVSLRGVAISNRKRLQYKLEKNGKTFSGDSPTHQLKMQGMGSFSKAFTQHMPSSGHVGVFFRHKNTGKLMEAYGPSLQFFMYDDDLNNSCNKKAHEYFMQEFPKDFYALTRIRL